MCVQQVRLVDRETGKERFVPCGRCPECLSVRRSSWTFRNLVALASARRSYFLTLTYEDGAISLYPKDFDVYASLGLVIMRKRAYQNFLKRLRNAGFDFSYFGVHEFGSREGRSHFHFCLYLRGDLELTDDVLSSCWPYGYHTCEEVTQARIHYCTKDLMKPERFYWKRRQQACPSGLTVSERLEWFAGYLPYARTYNMMSLKPAIGEDLLRREDLISFIRFQALELNMYPTISIAGTDVFYLPRYYLKKIFSDEERQLIARNLELSMKRDKRRFLRNSGVSFEEQDKARALLVWRRFDDWLLNRSTFKGFQL